MIGRLRRRGAALGAVVAQFSQAIGSFLLSLLAQHFLGVDGLGRFALVYGLIVVATSVITGLVGDSLTVLDRASPAVRAALQRYALIVSTLTGVGLTVGGWASGSMSFAEGLLAGAACWLFVVEDCLRRMLMATIRFWSLATTDITALVVSVGFVLTAAALGDVHQTTILAGLGLGQLAATILAVRLLPSSERWLARDVAADMGAPWRYGSWRALQQMFRPGMMTVVRFAVVGALGITVFGSLEAARLFVAPAMLMVSGASTYLFASYARDRSRPLDELRRRADRMVAALGVLTLAAGVCATIAAGPLGRFVVDDGDTLSQAAVFGWALYASASAAVTPYGSLAAVRGRQLHVLQVRAGESVVSIMLVVVALWARADAVWVPFLLALASAMSGIVMRRLLYSPAAPVLGVPESSTV